MAFVPISEDSQDSEVPFLPDVYPAVDAPLATPLYQWVFDSASMSGQTIVPTKAMSSFKLSKVHLIPTVKLMALNGCQCARLSKATGYARNNKPQRTLLSNQLPSGRESPYKTTAIANVGACSVSTTENCSFHLLDLRLESLPICMPQHLLKQIRCCMFWNLRWTHDEAICQQETGCPSSEQRGCTSTRTAGLRVVHTKTRTVLPLPGTDKIGNDTRGVINASPD